MTHISFGSRENPRSLSEGWKERPCLESVWWHQERFTALPEPAFEALSMSVIIMGVAISCDEENDADDVNDDDGDVDVIDDEKKGLALELLLIAFATDGFF